MQKAWVSLIISELEKLLKGIELVSCSDIYANKQEDVFIDFDLEFINKLIWKQYTETQVIKILNNLWIKVSGDKLQIPFGEKI